MKKNLLSFLFLSLLVGGCGYVTHSALPTNWHTIAVPPFANKIDFTSSGSRNLYIPLLEVNVRNAIINRFQFDGNLKAAKGDEADLVLHGELVNYSRAAVRYDDSNNVVEYRIQISVNLKLTEGQNGPVVWQETGFTGESSYFLSGSQAKPESQALNDAETDLARRVVERTVENW